ncbi:Ig domain OX-2-like protein [Cotia virus SPAn232]|uniref:Ig domain OX-2-like protein n=2 Tax=Cotia virus TaxID=39444 RepID=A0A097IVY9_9POXV|nr:Ig domain OX-2-like protein [Cotia virus SPAn232]AFB76955.1 Ig domain OX-2-like protein [Cotia virus SPAn232]AIT70768.1 Ig domain OX-2-like protein [Cotia virus]
MHLFINMNSMYMIILFALFINKSISIHCNSIIKNDTIEIKCYKTLTYSTLYIEWKSSNETLFVYNNSSVLSSNKNYVKSIIYIPKGLNITTISTYKNITKCYDCIFHLNNNITDTASICVDNSISENVCMINNNAYNNTFNNLLFILLIIVFLY